MFLPPEALAVATVRVIGWKGQTECHAPSVRIRLCNHCHAIIPQGSRRYRRPLGNNLQLVCLSCKEPNL